MSHGVEGQIFFFGGGEFSMTHNKNSMSLRVFFRNANAVCTGSKLIAWGYVREFLAVFPKMADLAGCGRLLLPAALYRKISNNSQGINLYPVHVHMYSAGKSRAQAREDRERAQARAREPWTGEPYEL